jgi:hypothetical protein
MRATALVAGVLALAAAGCGSSSPSSPSPMAPALPQQSELTFSSASINDVGLGRTYRFTQSDSTFQDTRSAAPGSIVFNVDTNDRRSWWTLRLGAPAGQELRVGTYENAEWYTAAAGSRPRFDLSGEGRACGPLEARFEIRTLTYRGTVTVGTGATLPVIDRLHVIFSQRCTATSAPGLTGEFFYIAPP